VAAGLDGCPALHVLVDRLALQALEVQVSVTSCGLVAAVGQYVVAPPGVGKIAVSRRLDKPANGDGGGRELARYRHTTSPFSLVCCTPAIVLPDALCNLADPSPTLYTLILWTLVDEKDVRCADVLSVSRQDTHLGYTFVLFVLACRRCNTSWSPA
jgi:hypothetical protein